VSAAASIEVVAERDLGDLLPLMRGYCDFYEVSPSDERLLAMSHALIADPEREGEQLIAREAGGRAAGFATLFWSWQTLDAGRIGVMNDLFVEPCARGTGLGAALIEACAQRARAHGAKALVWETALDNVRAQKVYAAAGAKPSRWLTYELELGNPAAPSSSVQPE
jgi:GNAT superfamily N-acetyltransferase